MNFEIIGVTATRKGITSAQRARWQNLLRKRTEMRELHHGDCVGGDDQLATECWQIRPNDVYVVKYPGNISDLCAHNPHYDEAMPPAPPLARNADINDVCTVLVAFPATMQEELRSGTWSTVRDARRKGRHLFIIWPDGAVTEENRGH